MSIDCFSVNHEYTHRVYLYEQIIESPFYLVNNKNNAIDYSLGSRILFAMSKQKPIVMLEQPRFSKDIDLFSKQLIEKHLNKILLVNINLLDEREKNDFLESIDSRMNYVLTKHEKVLIKSRVNREISELLVRS